MAEEKALDIFGETFVFELKEEFLNKVVNVEFCCCDHVKKAIDGKLVEVGRDFIELVKVDFKPIVVILFGDDNQEHKELYDKIIIPIERICSVGDPFKKCKNPCPKDDDDSYATEEEAAKEETKE